MDSIDNTPKETLELRPAIGLTRGLPLADLESLTVDAILCHRRLVARADALFQELPDDYKSGKLVGGAQHLQFIEASLEMHAQMTVANTLIDILGYIPKISAH